MSLTRKKLGVRNGVRNGVSSVGFIKLFVDDGTSYSLSGSICDVGGGRGKLVMLGWRELTAGGWEEGTVAEEVEERCVEVGK